MQDNQTSDRARQRLIRSGIDAATVLESTTDGIVILDREWRFVYLNNHARELVSGGRDLVGEIIWEALPRPPGGVFETACRKAMAEWVPIRCEDVYPPLGIWFENSIHPCSAGIVVYFRDVTAVKRQQQALRASEDQSRQQLAELEAIYAAAPVGLAVLGADGRFLRLNERAAAMTGLPVAAHIGRTIREVLPQFADRFEAIVRRIVETGEPVLDLEVEGETAAQPGVKRAWIGQCLPQKDAAGKVVCINVVGEDITERKRIEAELRDKNAELQAVLDAVPAGVFIAHDPLCRVISANKAAARLLRLAPGANASRSETNPERPRNFSLLRNGVEIPAKELPMQQAAEQGKEIRGAEIELLFDSGELRFVHGNATPLRDAAGNVRGAVGTYIDITPTVQARQVLARGRDELEHIVAERTREITEANERLRREKEFTELLLASTTDGIFAFDRELRYTLWNPAMERISGMSAAQVLGRVATKVFPFIAGTETESVMRGVVLGVAGAVRDAPYDVPETGRKGYYDCDYAPLRDCAGKVTGAVAILRDTTRRRAMEQQLRQAQKMDAVGQLTGGVAHDFNNLLTVVAGNLELIQSRAARDEKIGRLVAAALRAAARGSRLTAQLLAFSREQKLQPETVQLPDLVLSFEDVLKRALGEAITLDIAFDASLGPCRVDTAQFETALLNLVLNARDAMPGGGRVGIDIRNVDRADAAAAQLADGSYIRVAVSDTGCGMTAETMQRAFEPFFTTKDVGKGTGLGLSMVYGFAKQSGGHIGIESTADSGTTVVLYLPRAEATQADRQDAGEQGRPSAGSETILVAEDDALVRDVIMEMLSDVGYKVLNAGAGREAIELLRSRRDIDLLLTDIVMPGGMSGIELAREARRLRPDAAVLIVSGYAERVLTAQQARDEFPILAKPLHQASLARTVRGLLDTRRAQVV